jgi:hypothetical protein
MSAVLFELLSEPLRCGHQSHSSVAVRHGSDGPYVDDVTEQEPKVIFVLLVYKTEGLAPGSAVEIRLARKALISILPLKREHEINLIRFGLVFRGGPK